MKKDKCRMGPITRLNALIIPMIIFSFGCAKAQNESNCHENVTKEYIMAMEEIKPVCFNNTMSYIFVGLAQVNKKIFNINKDRAIEIAVYEAQINARKKLLLWTGSSIDTERSHYEGLSNKGEKESFNFRNETMERLGGKIPPMSEMHSFLHSNDLVVEAISIPVSSIQKPLK